MFHIIQVTKISDIYSVHEFLYFSSRLYTLIRFFHFTSLFFNMNFLPFTLKLTAVGEMLFIVSHFSRIKNLLLKEKKRKKKKHNE